MKDKHSMFHKISAELMGFRRKSINASFFVKECSARLMY